MIYTTLLDRIYNSSRQILDTNLFKGPTKICLLDFIGANDYFITDFGCVWNRNKVFPNKKTGYVFKQYLPMVKLDAHFNMQWVLLPTQHGRLWFPISHLVGYAFNCPTDRKLKYCLPKGNLCYHGLEYLKWTDSCLQIPDSRYIEFVDYLYS